MEPARILHEIPQGADIWCRPLGRPVLRFCCGLNQRPSGSRPRSAPRGGRSCRSRQNSHTGFAGLEDPLVRMTASLDLARPDPEPSGLRRFPVDRTEGQTGQGAGTASANRKEITMAKSTTSSRQHSRPTARVVQLRKGATIEMVRLTCPDEAQALRIAESFGTAILDSDGIRDMHERLIIETATGLSDGLGERAMQIHLQRIVGAYVGSAHGAGQFYSKAVTEARDATAKSASDARDEDLDGPVGYDSAAQRKREFAADMGIQAHALRLAVEGAVAAYEQIVGEAWKPFDRPVDNPGQTLDRKAAEAQMDALG